MNRHLQFFIDFEATGNDPVLDDPIEVAGILCDTSLTELCRAETLIRPSRRGLRRLRSCLPALEMHQANGLYQLVGDPKVCRQLPSVADAENQLLGLLTSAGVPDGDLVTLAGSGVGHFDLQLIRHHMPRLAARLTYWTNDVGVLRRNYARVNGRMLTEVNNDKPHRAMADIELHLEESRAFDKLLSGSGPHAFVA